MRSAFVRMLRMAMRCRVRNGVAVPTNAGDKIIRRSLVCVGDHRSYQSTVKNAVAPR
jgi:hypothetical protein